LPAPSKLFVFIDEDQASVNDPLFVVIVDPGWYMNDIPTRIHKTAYPLSFADGHAEAFKILCGDTLAWKLGQPSPPEIASDGSVNQDIINLRNAAYIPWQRSSFLEPFASQPLSLKRTGAFAAQMHYADQNPITTAVAYPMGPFSGAADQFVVSVPEPSSSALAATGSMALGMAGWRRLRRVA